MAVELDQFHEVFFVESFEALDTMEGALLQLVPGAADAETVNTIFRVAHSIKGGAGMFGFNEVAAFTHTLETLLDELRGGRMQVTTPLCEGLLQSVDQIRGMLAAIQKQQPFDPATANALKADFNRLIGGGERGGEPGGGRASARPAARESVPEPAGAGERRRWRIGFKALPELLNRGNDPLRIFGELAGLGELTVVADGSAVPELPALNPETCYICWQLELATGAPRSAIELIFEWAEGDCELDIQPLDAGDTAPPPAPGPAPEPQQPQRAAPVNAQAAAEVNSIRVAIEKIDELLNTVGEIVITQSMLSQLSKRFEGVDADRLRSGLAQLDMNVRELQECVMRVRMLPVGSVFSRFPRLVRDISTRLGKKIRLQISGEQTELDKTVLEKIGDPLVHLVRNSVDHGIESPEARLTAGKPEEGTVHLNAYHKGGSINIVISDDGGGLNKERILEKARSKGLIDANAAPADQQIFELIFLPGFSTAAQTTDLSGRGVGMDVVRRNIKDLGGNVELQSELGKGTTITITLPLTLAIVDGQTVSVGTETYIVPLVTVVESLQLRTGAVSRIHDHGEVFSFRGEYLPIIRLHQVFGVVPRSDALHDGLIMVVEGDGRRAGLFIDQLLGQQQVVIKSMETNYARIEGVGGATILGEGMVALILDVPGLLRLAPPVQPLRTGT
ncbi:MAG TPA: chemotaxis protein CheA [Steroidobacteraceae bacterium]|nr:chemotaxis protein CheA [Steroidobacteraceae bacterium]